MLFEMMLEPELLRAVWDICFGGRDHILCEAVLGGEIAQR